MQENPLSLLELNNEIKTVIRENTARGYWVVGEISELKVNYSGHCYLELIQKDKDSEKILARNRATIWAQNFRLIKPYFETTTGQLLCEGISILVKVNVEFHEVYGLSLNIRDIEPSYTVGDMALRKQQIIERLTEEGVIDMNKELLLSVPCQKIAVISSPTAAGYEDFVDQLEQNPFGYRFYLKLYPAVMQGEEAESSVIDALDRIFQHESFFDAVVIIRGGGSQTDLNCFNKYWLAFHISQFPLPVITGIGHEQDDSVADRVAHTRLKTPTAVAAFLIDRMAQHETDLNSLAGNLREKVTDQLDDLAEQLNDSLFKFQRSVSEKLKRHKNRLHTSGFLLHKYSLSRIGNLKNLLNRRNSRLSVASMAQPGKYIRSLEGYTRLLRQALVYKQQHFRQHLSLMEQKVAANDPARVLEKGYSVTLKEGRAVKDASLLKENDSLVTLLKKGEIESIVKKTK